MDSMDSRLKVVLFRSSLLVDGSHVIDSRPGLSQFHISLLLAPVCRVQQCTRLLQFSLESIGLSLSKASLLSNFHLLEEFFLQERFSVPQLSLVTLDRLVSFRVGFVGVVKSNFQLIDVSLQLLLDPQGLSLGTRLSLKGSLHGLHGTLVIFACVVKLLFLLMDLAINFLANLSKLKLSTKNLVFFLLKCSLSLLKSCLELFLLNLQTAALLVKLVNGAASISQLVKQILDLISQILVLPLNNIQLLNCFIPCSLQPEELTVVVTVLLLAGFNFSKEIVDLGLPFSNNLIKVLATALSDDGSSMDPLVLELQIFKLSFKTVLGLLSAGNLLVQGLNCLLSLLDTGAQLVLATLKLINTSKTFSLVFGPPQLAFSLGLGEGFESIRLLLIFLFNALLEIFQLSVHVLELAQERSTIPGLSISHPLGVLQLGSEGDFVLTKSSNGILGFLHLSLQILVLNLKLFARRVSLIQSPCHLIQLLVSLNNEALSKLSIPLMVSPLPHGLIQSSPGLLEVTFHASLILLSLGLHLVQSIDVLSHFSHVVVVLLPQSSQGTFMGNVGLLQLSL